MHNTRTRVLLLLLCTSITSLHLAFGWISTTSARNNKLSVSKRPGKYPQLTATHVHTEDYEGNNEKGSSTRRQWLSGVAHSASLLAISSLPAQAAPPKAITSSATCDATVTVWQREDRLIYLLGTAHISEKSSELAGQLVRDTRPNGVFVELDLKRVAGPNVDSVMASGKSDNMNKRTVLKLNPENGQGKPTTIIIPDVTESIQRQGSNTASSITSDSGILQDSAPTPFPASNMPRKSGGVFSTVLNVGAGLVGNAIRSMYKNLDDAGFKPGEEFMTAIREGQAIDADIILGDQDVEITLQRLTQALASTDLKRLLNPDSELEESINALIGMQGEPADTLDPADPDAFKEGLTSFVETIKTRETVRSIMGQLRIVAPALVQVMLTERDTYMAAGLDTLNQETVIVAVMGIAHVDGVEANLQRQGWSPVKLNCPQQ